MQKFRLHLGNVRIEFLTAIEAQNYRAKYDNGEGLIEEINESPPPAVDVDAVIDAAVQAAQVKGEQILKTFTRENVKLGIEVRSIAGRPATDVILERTANIVNALRSGSTKAARRFCLAVPEDHKDGIFISNERLLQVIHEIENYHGMPLTESL